MDANGFSPMRKRVDTLSGRAITAPLVVEAMQRIGDGRGKANGVLAPGEVFDARDFLESLPEVHLAFADE